MTDSRLKNFYSAAREGKLEEVRKSIIKLQLSKEERYNWFYRATIDKQKDIAQLLLFNGLKPSNTSCGNITVDKAKTDVIRILEEKITQDDDFPASLFMDLAICEGNENLFTLLLSKGFDVNVKVSGPFTAIQRAVMLGHPKIVQTLLAKNANVNTKYKGSTLLHAAVFRGDVETTELLLQHGATVNAERQRDGSTALYTAVERGFLTIVEKLINAGANFKAKFTTNSLDPLKKTIICHQDIIFIQSGLKPNQLATGKYRREDGKNWTLLHLAAEKGYESIVELLLKKGIEANSYDNYCRTPLYWAALNCHEEVVRLLCRHGADIDATDIDYHTPLHCFVTGGYFESAQICLRFGADYNAETANGHTPLFFASEYRHPRIVDLLLRCGAEQKVHIHREQPDRYAWQLLFEHDFPGLPKKDAELLRAIFMWFEPKVRLLLEQGANVDSVAANQDGRSALIIAADRGDLKIVNTLLEFGANTALKDSTFRERSALHTAAENGFYPIVKALMMHGADTEIRDKDGATPLLLAVLEGAFGPGKPQPRSSCLGVVPDYLKVIKVLLKFGADFNTVDDHKRTPLNLAAFRREQPKPLKAILEYGNANTHVIPEIIVNQLFDHIPSVSESWWDEDELRTKDELMRYFIKMKAAKLYVNEPNYVAKEFNLNKIQAFQRKCETEVLKMQKEMIGNTATSFYDIFTAKVSKLAVILRDPSQRETIVKTLNTYDYRRKFPIYGNMVYNQLEKGLTKHELLKKGIKTGHALYNSIYPLPDEISEYIVTKFLSVSDLRNLSAIQMKRFVKVKENLE